MTALPKALIAGSVYLAGVFLTGGAEWHRYTAGCPNDVWRQTCLHSGGMSGFLAGMAWPIYWATRGAVEITRPGNPAAVVTPLTEERGRNERQRSS